MLAWVQPNLAVLPKMFQRLQLEKVIPCFAPLNGRVLAQIGGGIINSRQACLTHRGPAEAGVVPGWDVNPELSDSSFFLPLTVSLSLGLNLEDVFPAPWSKEGPSKPWSP